MIPECSRQEWLAAKVSTDEEARRIILPLHWGELIIPMGDPMFGLRAYAKGGLKVLYSVDPVSFDKPWVHVSCSRKDRIPSYEDLMEVKKIFIGDGRQAIQVFPVKAKHINIHPNCLHLWACLGDDGLPDFGKFGTI